MADDDKRVILIVGGVFPFTGALAELLNHPDAEVVDLIKPDETSPTFEGLDRILNDKG